MLLTSLTLQHFRSYQKSTFTFVPTTTLIVGPNAAGKTNLLEAIYLLATGKSFRADRESEMISWGENVGRVIAQVGMPPAGPAAPLLPDGARIPHLASMGNTPKEEGYAPSGPFRRVTRSQDTLKLEMILTTGEVTGQKVPTKKYFVNGVPRRQVDFIGNLRAVLFWPEHLELVTDSPSLRRSYLDSVLTQIDREYRRNLLSYERGLRQRNRLLDLISEGKAGRTQLLFWNQLLIRAGEYLTQKRQEFIDFINQADFSAPKFAASYQLVYDKSIISPARLAQYAEEEIAAKATLVGPHRDDFGFYLLANGHTSRDLSKFGSRGEQRLAVLWLKLGELAFIESIVGERPLLLLDDIFSELDAFHRQIILQLVSSHQSIITSAEGNTEVLFKKKSKNKITIIPLTAKT